MTERDARDIARRRLRSQGLAGAPFTSMTEVVGWLGAVQAQEYAVAKWSVGQRATGLSDAAVDAALADGALVRTHVLRPTWHLVAAADLRWLLALSAPRVHITNGTYYRKFGLDDALLARSTGVLAEALSGGAQLTRKEIAALLTGAGIELDGLRLGYVLMYAELEAVICSGALKGKQHTYALVDDRVPPAPAWERDAALAELTRRYYLSHGPATRADFQWWASLTAADAMRGLALAWKHLEHLVLDGVTYWYGAAPSPGRDDPSPTVHLLQAYDDYFIAYSESRWMADLTGLVKARPEGVPAYLHPIILDGQYIGSWRRSLARERMRVEAQLCRPLRRAEHQALEAAIDRYAMFVGRPAELVLAPTS